MSFVRLVTCRLCGDDVLVMTTGTAHCRCGGTYTQGRGADGWATGGSPAVDVRGNVIVAWVPQKLDIAK